jgi:multicomponent Na+:H+ antiporter subunit D
MIAFSSVAQVGFILLGISLASADGLSASCSIMVAHAPDEGDDVHGAGRACAQSLAPGGWTISPAWRVRRHGRPWRSQSARPAWLGTPLTIGFLAKWRLIEAAITSGQVWIVAVHRDARLC